jgi:hypothetical protein
VSAIDASPESSLASGKQKAFVKGQGNAEEMDEAPRSRRESLATPFHPPHIRNQGFCHAKLRESHVPGYTFTVPQPITG